MQSAIGPGDEIMTVGGLYGTVTRASMTRRSLLEIAPGVTARFAAAAIGKVTAAGRQDAEVDEAEDAARSVDGRDADDAPRPSTRADA